MASQDSELPDDSARETALESGLNRYVTMCLALVGSMCLGALLVFFVDSLFGWTYTPVDYAVGEITLIAYPKYKEYRLFLFAAPVIAALMAAGIRVQRRAGRAAQRYLGIDPRIAWWATGIALMLPPLIYLLGNLQILLILSLAAVGVLLLSPVILLLIRFVVRMSASRPVIIASVLLAVMFAAIRFATSYYITRQKPPDQFHEGAERLAPARTFLEGGVPYRDFFIVHGLCHNTLTTAAAFKLFGMSLHSDRLFRAMLDGAALLAVIFLLRLLFGPGLLAPVVGGTHFFIVDHRLLTFYLLACFLIMVFKTSGKKTWCFMSGLTASLCFLWSWDIGAVGIPAAGLILLLYGLYAKSPRRRVLSILTPYILGVLVVALPVGFYLYANEALDAFLQTHLEILRAKDHWDGSPFPGAEQLLEARNIPKAAFPYFTTALVLFALYAGADLLIRGKWGPMHWLVLFLIIFCVPFMKRGFGNVLGLAITGQAPMFLLILLFLGKAANTGSALPRYKVYTAAAVICALVVPVFFSLILLQWDRPAEYSGPDVPLQGDPQIESMVARRLGRININAREFREICEVCEFLTSEESADDSFFDFTYGGLFYYLMPSRNPSRYLTCYYPVTRKMQQSLIADLERAKPRYVIHSSSPLARNMGGPHIEIRHALIAEYLYKHYIPVKTAGKYIIAERDIPENLRESRSLIGGTLYHVYDFGRVPEIWGRYYLQDIMEGAQILHTAENVAPEQPDSEGYAKTWSASLPPITREATYPLVYARSKGSGRVELSWRTPGRPSNPIIPVSFLPRASDGALPYIIRVGSLSAWLFEEGQRDIKIVFFGDGALKVEKIVAIKKKEY
ncbi:MAG: hypothetical protein ABIH04_11315 [Planctomycetota bacterium]